MKTEQRWCFGNESRLAKKIGHPEYSGKCITFAEMPTDALVKMQEVLADMGASYIPDTMRVIIEKRTAPTLASSIIECNLGP